MIVALISTKLPIWASSPISDRRPQPANGPTIAPRPIRAPSKSQNERITAPSPPRDPGPNTHVGLDHDVARELCVGGKTHRVGRNHGDAGLERRRAQPLLHDRLRLGEFGLSVHARAPPSGPHFQRDGLEPFAARDGDGVGEIELALGVVVGDLVKDGERGVAAQPHHAGIAQPNRLLRGACVLLLADGEKLVVLRNQAAIAGRISGTEAEHGDGRAVRQRRTQAGERARADQRRVAIDDHRSRAPAPARPGGEHGVGGSPPLGLNENLRLGRGELDDRGDGFMAGPMTTATLPPVVDRDSTCSISGRPAMVCNTFGRGLRMRVPSPAASTMVEQVVTLGMHSFGMPERSSLRAFCVGMEIGSLQKTQPCKSDPC